MSSPTLPNPAFGGNGPGSAASGVHRSTDVRSVVRADLCEHEWEFQEGHKEVGVQELYYCIYCEATRWPEEMEP